jgi:basic membrane protein A
VLSGCGGDGEPDAENAPTASVVATRPTPAPAAPSVRVGLVTAAGRTLGDQATEGLERAEDELGVAGRVLVSRADRDHERNLARLASEGYDLVIAGGPTLAEAVDRVARQFPHVHFAIVDVGHEELPSRPRNVRGLVFEEEEAGYLVGYLAGLVTRHEAGSKQVIGSVGGTKRPSVDRYIAGYRAGARRANPRVVTLNAYSDDFVDQAKCKELALEQMARGARIVFQVAGRCGLGVLAAAAEQNLYGIGVDWDQSRLGRHVLASALKRVDVAVFQTIQAEQEGAIVGGEDAVFDVASGGVGIGEIAPDVPPEVVTRVHAIEDALAAGEITSIPETVG